MRRPLVTAEHVHGPTGSTGRVFPDPQMPLQAQHGVDFIVETLMAAEPASVTLCTLGPLTNVAHGARQGARHRPRHRARS